MNISDKIKSTKNSLGGYSRTHLIVFSSVDIAEEFEEHAFSSNLLTIRNVELGNSFKSLELDTDSSRGSRESLDSLASEQSADKVILVKIVSSITMNQNNAINKYSYGKTSKKGLWVEDCPAP